MFISLSSNGEHIGTTDYKVYQENNILIFDVVNDEIQGIYLEKKDLAYLIVMSNNYYLNLAPLTNVFC